MGGWFDCESIVYPYIKYLVLNSEFQNKPTRLDFQCKHVFLELFIIQLTAYLSSSCLYRKLTCKLDYGTQSIEKRKICLGRPETRARL